MVGSSKLRWWAAALMGIVLATVVALAGTAHADFPYNPTSSGSFDAHTYKLPAAVFPTNLGDDFKLAASPETPSSSDPQAPLVPANNAKQDELCGIRGTSIVDIHATQPAGTARASRRAPRCAPPSSPAPGARTW